MLYDDFQAAVPVAFCPECGGEIYGPGGCLRCRVRGISEETEQNHTDEQVKFIRETIEQEHLTYTWLSLQILRVAGIKTCRSEISSVLAQTRSGPKADKIICVANKICEEYRSVFS